MKKYIYLKSFLTNFKKNYLSFRFGEVSNFRRVKDRHGAYLDYPYLSCAEYAQRDMHGFPLWGRKLVVRVKEREVPPRRQRREEEVPRYKNPRTQKNMDDLALDAVSCHICNIFTFESQDDFLKHLKSEKHNIIAKLYHDKSHFISKMLKYNSKVRTLKTNSQNQMLKFGGYCSTCECCIPFLENETKNKMNSLHSQTVEHKLVDHFVNKRCCGNAFSSRRLYEDHKLLFEHMKNRCEKAYKSSKDVNDGDEQDEDDEEDNDAPEWMTDASIEEFFKLMEKKKEEYKPDEDQYNFDSLPEYDPTTPIGRNHVNWFMILNCNVCQSKSKLKTRNCSKTFHYRSFDHYCEVVRHLIKEVKRDDGYESSIESESKDEIGERMSDLEEPQVEVEELGNSHADSEKAQDDNEEEEKEEEKMETQNVEENIEVKKENQEVEDEIEEKEEEINKNNDEEEINKNDDEEVVEKIIKPEEEKVEVKEEENEEHNKRKLMEDEDEIAVKDEKESDK